MRNTSRVHASLFTAAVLAAVLFAPAIAGEYHTGSTLYCSDCHIAPAGLSGDLSGAIPDSGQDILYQLKGATTTATCLQCHDNQPGTPDVVGTDVNNPAERYDGRERAAGQFSDSDANNYKGHNLPGRGGDSIGDCGMCHDPHGNGNYRNLRALVGAEVGPIAFVNPRSTKLDRYRRENIGYVKNMGDKLCIGCHQYASPSEMIASSGLGRYKKHPSSSEGMLVTMTGRHASGEHWVRGTGLGFEVHGQAVPRLPFAVSTATDYYRATLVSQSDEVFCLSCHKAHGSKYAFGLQWPYGGNDGEAGAQGCNQCHSPSEE